MKWAVSLYALGMQRSPIESQTRQWPAANSELGSGPFPLRPNKRLVDGDFGVYAADCFSRASRFGIVIL